MSIRLDNENLARELTLGVLSFADLVRRARVVARWLFPRHLTSVDLVVIDVDQPNRLEVFHTESAEGKVEEDRLVQTDPRIESLAVRLDEPLLLAENQAAELHDRGIEPPPGVPPVVLLLPVRRNEDRLGALILGFDSMERTEITRRWAALRNMTAIVASTLQSCHAHEKTLAERRELERIARAGSRLQILSSCEETCHRAARLMVREFLFSRCIILLPSEDGTRLAGVCSEGYEDVCELVQMPVESTSDLLAQVHRTGTPWIGIGPQAELAVPVIMRERGLIYDAVALPLRLADEPIGVLWADHAQPGAWMPEHRLTLLSIFATQLAAAISNSRMLRRIELLAETDPLTGVANRRHLESLLVREIPRVRRKKSTLSLMMVDIDQFKNINDEFGHEYGDRVLRQLAEILRGTVRGADTVARFGGDEFVVLMPETNEEQAIRARQRLEEAVSEFNNHRPANHPILSLSIGIRSADSESVETLLSEADRSMYASKEETIRAGLLEALITDRRSEVVRWDHFVANSLKVLGEKEPWYLDHSRRVMQLVLNVGRAANLSERECVSLGLAGLLHDIGKISIPVTLLTRPGPLTSEEQALVRTHCELGEDLLKSATYLGPVRRIIRAHHERYDGRRDGPYSGYPDGISGESIPIGARILKIADTYDAITSGRSYQAARPPLTAIEILRSEKGKSLDPVLVDLFISYIHPHLIDGSPCIPEDMQPASHAAPKDS